MSLNSFNLSELYKSYKTWIIRNPDKASDFETTAKWVSYFVVGRINNSYIVSELVYALSNLLVFFNDRLIASGKGLQSAKDNAARLKAWMTVLEYSEVFLELSAEKTWGKTGKWLVVVCIQVFKCIARFVLIQKYKESIIQSPPIQMLDRMNVNDPREDEIVSNGEIDSISFSLKRSGKLIRKVDSVSPSTSRNWKPPEVNLTPQRNFEEDLRRRKLFAEILYITKPLAHLCGSACFGYNTWKPWTISLMMDIASLHLYYTCMQIRDNSLTKQQRLQLSKRTLVMVLYLMRSPFYERYTRRRVEGFLRGLGNKVPLLGVISQPLLNYLPFWQGNYFYMWST